MNKKTINVLVPAGALGIPFDKNDLINGKYTLLQRGRKNYYLLIVN